jgi:hypothetical protein
VNGIIMTTSIVSVSAEKNMHFGFSGTGVECGSYLKLELRYGTHRLGGCVRSLSSDQHWTDIR